MSASESTAPAKGKKINLRTPDVMAKVQEQVESHYRSTIVERLRANGGILQVRDTTVLLAQQFCFCYGVERAIDLAYAARKDFKHTRLIFLCETIANTLVHEHVAEIGVMDIIGDHHAPA